MPSQLQQALYPGPNEDISNKFVPFTAFLQVTEINGNHEEIYNQLKKLAAQVAGDIDDICGMSEEVELNFSRPVAFTVRFGSGNTNDLNDLSGSSNVEVLQQIPLNSQITVNWARVPTAVTARLTITGNACPRKSFTALPVGEQKDEGDYEQMPLVGYGNGNASNEVPDADVLTVCRELKTAIEAVTGLTVFRLEVAGFIFGQHGMTFP